MREVVLDTETTGLDPAGGHRIVEIGCVELANSIPTGKVFHEYLNPERDMPEEAFRVHGLSQDFLRDKPLFSARATAFLEFLEDARLVIHNAEFDMKFINAELSRIGQPIIGMNRVTDTLLLARRKHPGVPNSLDALCSRYHIDNSRRTKHGALLDSEILAEVYIELTGGHQKTLELSAIKIHTTRVIKKIVISRPAELATRLTEAEAEAHASFVKELGDKNIWRSYLPLGN